MQNQSGTGKDPIAQLDAAMQETFVELGQQGSGVSPSEVLAPTTPESDEPAPSSRPRRRAQEPRREARDDDRSEDAAPRRRSQERSQEPRRRAARGRDPAAVILDEADDDNETTADGGAGTRRRRDATREPEAPERGPDGRFLPGRADTAADADEDSDDEDSADEADGRRYADAEEADVEEDDDAEPESRRRAEDDEGEDEDGRERGRGRRRFPRAVQREIDRRVATAVEDRVGKVIEERDRLRESQRQTQQVEAEAIDTLVKAIGTQEQRGALQQIVNNPRAPLEQRNRAAATLQRYQANEQYVRTYGVALKAAHRQEQQQRRQEGMAHLGRYQIALDEQIVHGEDPANLMAHVARQAILAERQRSAGEIDRLKRQLATRGGAYDERAVRNGGFGSPSLASSNGRRANGKVATVDRLRGSLGFDRGLGSGTQVPMPTDRVLQQLRDGEITLKDLGLDQ